MTSILYISYDGMLEPLGQSQVLAYLKRLADGRRIHLISFEKPHDWLQIDSREALRNQIRAAGITWIPLRYHKRPSALATAFDIAQGVVVGAWAVMRHRVRIVHARSYVPSVIALVLKRLFRLKYIFDMRGFWADERVDGGLWPKGSRLYRMAKWFERRFLLSADRVVSLTQAAVDEMRQFPYLQGRMPKFEVITTCADLDLFKPDASEPSTQKDDRPFTLGYVGSVGLWYIFDETLQCFKLLRQAIPDARLHILNRGDHTYIRERLNVHKVDPESVRLEVADHAGVVRAMGQMDAGIFFIKPVYSKMASAPTKLGEFLGCGIPCLSNAGVGDMASILEKEQVGVALSRFDETAMREAIEHLLQLTQTPGIKARCREVALRYFSLDEGVTRYRAIYDHLMDKNMKLNLDHATVNSFGDEWSRFDQTALDDEEARTIFEEYFSVFPWSSLPENASGFDMGCGSGRWARLMAPRVGHLHCIDPSSSLEVAKSALSSAKNVSFIQASVDDSPLPPNSQDFGYSLGVLHHVPDTARAIRSCVEMIKPGAPFLLYLYYAFDNRSALFKFAWRCSDLLRRGICKLPAQLKHLFTDTLAVVVYYPLARFALVAERMGFGVASIPLSYYRSHSFYTMRTDSRDRFGTPLEQRFTRKEIAAMMEAAGLRDVCFSDRAPYWCAVGIKK